jgi:hypothetical protein
MARLLEVSRSGYYDWARLQVAGPSTAARRRAELTSNDARAAAILASRAAPYDEIPASTSPQLQSPRDTLTKPKPSYAIRCATGPTTAAHPSNYPSAPNASSKRGTGSNPRKRLSDPLHYEVWM